MITQFNEENVFIVSLSLKGVLCSVCSLCDQLDTRCQLLTQTGSECLWRSPSPSVTPSTFHLFIYFQIFTRLFLHLLHLQAALAISRLLFKPHSCDKKSSSVPLFLCLLFCQSHYSGVSASLYLIPQRMGLQRLLELLAPTPTTSGPHDRLFRADRGGIDGLISLMSKSLKRAKARIRNSLKSVVSI